MRKENRASRRPSLLLACAALSALVVGFASSRNESRGQSPRPDAPAPRASATPPEPQPPDPEDPFDTYGTVALNPSAPPALQCGLGTGYDAVTGQIDTASLKPGLTYVKVRFDDPRPFNEARTLLTLTFNGKTYQYHGQLKDATTVAQLNLPQGLFLMVGDSVSVRIDEQYTTAAGTSGACLMSKATALAARRVAFPPNPILLRDSSASQSPGCHGQAVKFDGVYFFSSCQELAGSDSLAVANIHDAQGSRLCRFVLGESFDHPSGIVIFPGELGAAYLGFSKWAGDFPSSDNREAQPIRIAYDHATRKCLSAPARLNGGGTIHDTTGFAVRVPENKCAKDTPWRSDILFYDDFTASVNKCPKSGGLCSFVPGTKPPGGSNSSQDCGYYWAGAWFRACIKLASLGNGVQVFKADAASMDEASRLADFTLGPPTSEWSGGLDIYQSRDGSQRYLLLAPSSASAALNCDMRQPCTTDDSKKAQHVEVFNFNDWNSHWPTNATHKICN